MKQRLLNSVKLAALIIFAGFLYAFSAKRNAVKKLDAIQMNFENSTNLLVSRSDVLQIINHYIKPKETKLVAIDNNVLARIESKLKQNKLIEDTSVYLSLTDTLFISVLQKKPIARIVGTKSYYLDDNAKPIPLSKNYTVRVPLVYGQFNADELLQIKGLIMRINTDELLKKQITAILKKDKNEYVFKGRLGDQTVQFGTLTNVVSKLKKLHIFYMDAWSKKRINKYKTINLKYHNQIVCTKI